MCYDGWRVEGLKGSLCGNKEKKKSGEKRREREEMWSDGVGDAGAGREGGWLR